MWRTGERPWAVHAPRFVSDELEPATRSPFGHRFFLYDLVRWGRPARIVELGAGTGAAFFACCQAVRDSGYPGSLHAIDPWDDVVVGATAPGDALERFEGARAQLFPALDVQLHRRDLRDARNEHDEESIDLLLLSGHASYEVVKDDYEGWLPKLAPGGVVILRDVAPWRRSGAAELWGELSSARPALTFVHSSGLGVLFPKGAEPFEYLLGDEFTRWQSYYEARELAHTFDAEMRAHAATLEDRDTRIGRLERETVGLRDQADAARRQLADQRAIAVAVPADAAPAPVSDTRRLVRLLARLLRRGARAANRRLGTNLRIGAVRSEIDDRIAAVFDAAYYLDRYPDIARAGVDPLDHYRRRGWIEDRDPSPLFWTEWYLKRYRDVAEAACEPLQYHLEIGWRAGHDPSPLLRTEWYLDRVADIRHSGLSPLEHYWTTGYASGEYANPEQRRRLIAAPSPVRPVRRVVSECELLAPGRGARLVTLDALARADVDLVTFDLWDTLVARARPADAAKLATARRIALAHAGELRAPMAPWDLFRHRVAMEAEIAGATAHEEYRLADVLERHLAAVLDVNGRTARALADDLGQQEADEECRCSYRIDELADTIERLAERDPAPKLMILSDFYLGADALRAVATAAGVGVPPEVDVLASCDLDASKRVGGRLFELARERAGTDASRHLHIGDNPWSDGEQQVATGGTAAIVRLSPSPFPGPGELDPQHLRALVDEQRDELLSVVDVLAPSGVSDTERRAAHAGVLTALLPVSLVAAAVEEALERGLTTVHYLSREGAFLRRIHELVAPTLAGASPVPAARHVEVSRRSTFGPSIAGDERAGLALMWSQYADQSPRALFESLGVSVDGTLVDAITAVDLTVDGVVAQVQDDERIAALLDRDEVRDHIERTLADRRRALDAYLRQAMDLDRPDVLVVDVGWRGTIQDNLARVLPEHRVHGLYLGLFPYLNPQPSNGTKRAVAFDANTGDPFVHVSPPAAIESPLTPDVPSPIDYSIRGAGRVMVVHEHEGPRARGEIEAFQAGVLAAAPRVAEWMVVNGLTSSMLGEELGEMVSEYYGRPEGGVADIWFGSTHDDTFGALNVSPFEKEPPPRGVLSRVATSDVVPDEARRSNWVSGYRAWLSVRALEVLREMWRERH